MDYTEHLISMAGGDGELDLDAIPFEAVEAVANIYAVSEDTGSLETARTALEAAHLALLALVRDQAAKLGRVGAAADELEAIASRSSYRDDEAVTSAWLESASIIRAAITATEASK